MDQCKSPFDPSSLLADVRTQRLLETIREQGGFAFVNLIMRVKGGDAAAAEIAYDMAWEQLHSGPWHAVHTAWRDAFTLSCILMAFSQTLTLPEALRYLDMGLLMGASLFQRDASLAIGFIQSRDKEKMEHSGPISHRCTFRVSMDPSSCTESTTARATGRISELSVGPMPTFENLHLLPERSLQCDAIERSCQPSLEEFLCCYLLPGIPVILTNAISHWSALRKWKNVDYLQDVAGDRTVPVEVGKHYLMPEWKQELVPFSELLKHIYEAQGSSTTCTYLAQHPLFEQLKEDIVIPDYCAFGGDSVHTINAWFGPAGTVTPLHHDPDCNLFAQVVGKKYVRLYPASVSESLYPYDESMLWNSSQVDLDNPDYKIYPLAKNLAFMDCVLEEGEMLYIPPKWWHYVRSLSPSFSVSFWWASANLAS
ncbi:hypothetical protein O6H91_02G121000 [Diphasiastrum complanatum]|uniref:Uncharacterized protein n=1 Tax=Diphasiastrum complanatum TaxID=34168 RepID=A0ACC2EK21_DIPCM|nr:hypothetical protein O6H91_02G121000 [Diphasiastrum complanatum]